MQTLIITLLKNVICEHDYTSMWRYIDMKMTYHNHNMEDYINYHDI